ncbi:hypothetical protein T4D_485 [Trichinella pseudospiralis]|uniref:Uncharacterized protein n=1 Tax=Trichinella pseudospiralis TaxID=6337 RepID=A0A0V1FX11_TRIPS|nr:hypothetical protein T4D_485 [Trichinella pseudospiralis]
MCSPLLRRRLDFITDNIRPKNKSEILSSIEDGEEKKLKMQITPSKKFIDGTKQIKTKQEIWTMKKRKSENADDTKQIADDTKQIEDDTKQNCGMKTYGICGSPWVPIL